MPPEINDTLDDTLGNQLRDFLDNDPDFLDETDDAHEPDNHDNNHIADSDTENKDTDFGNKDSDTENKDKDITPDDKNNPVGVEPPKSWSKEQHDLFKKLPQEAQQQIIKRENDVIQGIKNIYDKINPQINFAETVQNILKPYENDMKRLGDETGGINTLASFLEPARILNFGSPEQKANMLLNVAQQYGLDLVGFLQGIPQGQKQGQQQGHNPEVAALKQQINELTNLEKMRQIEADKQLENEVVSEITEIRHDKENYPFFNDVIKEMHNLVTSGLAENLKEAYTKAVLLNPATQEKIIAQQAQKLKSNEQQQNQQRVKQARQNALSPKSGSGFGFSNQPLDGDDFDNAMIKKLQVDGY